MGLIPILSKKCWPIISQDFYDLCDQFYHGDVKGKCALGPFLSILVIECQHKCLNVNLCSWMDKVQIKSKGMFLSVRNRKKKKRKEVKKGLAVYNQDSTQSGTPDCPVVHQADSARTGRSREFADGVRLKFTGLSGVHRTVR
jgi:hypothetical protein